MFSWYNVVYLCYTASNCDDAFQLDSRCYKVHKTERVSWFTAINKCQSLNASLAVFDDDLLQYFPSSLLSDSDNAWIGLHKSWWIWPGYSHIRSTKFIVLKFPNMTCLKVSGHGRRRGRIFMSAKAKTKCQYNYSTL